MGYDVIVVGSGPVGISTACMIQSMNKNLRICVIDKKEVATRHHGLSLGKEVLSKIVTEISKCADKRLAEIRKFADKALMAIFQKWTPGFLRKTKVVKTTEIEDTLAAHAKQVGITIMKGKDYEITPQNMETVFNSEKETKEQAASHLRFIFKNAKVVIAADGSHSTLRRSIIGPDEKVLVDQKNLEYFIEVKYDTPGTTEPISVTQSSMLASKTGEVALQRLPKGTQPDGTKRGTWLVYANKEIYDAFREEVIIENTKKIKGSSELPWKWAELQNRAESNPHVRNVVGNLERRFGKTKHSNEQIRTIPLDMYRSKETYRLFLGMHVLFAGDASSGLVLERGVNKGLLEALEVAKAVTEFFQNGQSTDKPFSSFVKYQIKARELFHKEKWWIEKRALFLKIGSIILSAITWPGRQLRAKIVNAWESFQENHADSSIVKPLQKVAHVLEILDTAVV